MEIWEQKGTGATLQLAPHQYLEIVQEGDVFHSYLVSHGEAAPLEFGALSLADAKLQVNLLLQQISKMARLAAYT